MVTLVALCYSTIAPIKHMEEVRKDTPFSVRKNKKGQRTHVDTEHSPTRFSLLSV